jgi:hypothetical protein
MRKSVVFLVGGAVILIAAAGVLRFAAVPELRQLPADLDTTLTYSGKADLLDAAAMQSGDLAKAFRTGVDVTAQQRVRVTSVHDRTAVVAEDITISGADGTKLSATGHVWAVDRKTLDAAATPAGAKADAHQGLVVGFPLSPEARDYQYWDALSQTAATAKYTKAERHADRDTYVYTMHASGPLKDPALAGGLPAALPKQVLMSLAPLLPAPQREALNASAALLPEQIPLAYTATADATYWVDRATGYVVDVNQKQTVAAALSLGGTSVPLANVFAADIKFTPQTVSAVTKDAADAESGLAMLGVTLPLILVALAVVLLIVAVLLAVRRRNPGDGKPAVPDQPVAPPAGVGAADEG